MTQTSTNNYREIGPITRLQIQRQSLKQPLEPQPGQRRSPERFYDPRHILAADALWLADGVATVAHGADYVLDVHAAAHPESRNRGNGNMLSVGFTSHYAQMRERFAPHITDGIAGENILVATNEHFALEDVAAGIAVRTADGALLNFGEVTVAAPCVEFSRFCLDDRYADPRPTSDALRFLDGGMRGFYAYVSAGLPTMLRIGDTLLARE